MCNTEGRYIARFPRQARHSQSRIYNILCVLCNFFFFISFSPNELFPRKKLRRKSPLKQPLRLKNQYSTEKQSSSAYYARVTLPERRQRVQAYTLVGVPLTIALTCFTLGFHVRLERRWEWETLIPKVTPLPQKSHFAI